MTGRATRAMRSVPTRADLVVLAGLPPERVGQILTALCSLSRPAARELVRRHQRVVP